MLGKINIRNNLTANACTSGIYQFGKKGKLVGIINFVRSFLRSVAFRTKRNIYYSSVLNGYKL